MFISNWIDIKKQEPQDRQSCLIYTQRGKIFRAEWYKGKSYKGDWYYSNRYYDSSTAIYWMPLPSAPNTNNEYNFEDDFFGAVINCAIRYACGRQSYMPSLVISVVKPMLPFLNDKTIGCMERDIREAEKYSGGYGDEKIDKPMWLKFLAELQKVMEERGIEKWQ